ncbi:LruC domain-containing protein [Butyricimonas paravirosa]
MRTKVLILALFFLSTIISSCAKKDIEHKEKETTGFTELVVPADFDWKMSENVTCNFTSEHVSKVYVSTGANTAPFASFYVGQDVDQVKLNIPTYINTLYVKYETGTGLSAAKALDINNNTVTYTVPTDSKEVVTPVASSAKMSLSRVENNDPVIYIPATDGGWATLMFEDLWPAYGDYDFNDLVANYKIQLYVTGKNKVEAILVGVRIKAVGGSLPYDLCLKINGTSVNNISSIDEYKRLNTIPSATLELINPNNNANTPIFRFKDIRTNPNRPGGYSYLNTDKEAKARLTEDKMVELAYMIYLDKAVNTTPLDFDFFIAKPVEEGASEWQEIHTGGYAPTEFGETVYKQVKEGNSCIGESTNYYHSNTHLVWAINIPTDIPHTYEKADFLKAYLHFKDWATSGGEQHKDWYENTEENRVRENLIYNK